MPRAFRLTPGGGACQNPESVWREWEFFFDNLLVRIHFIIVMIRWIGLAPWEFEVPFPGSLTSTFLERVDVAGGLGLSALVEAVTGSPSTGPSA